MNDAAKTDAQAIVVEEIFPHAPETVWLALITPALVAKWLGMTPTGFAPVPGTRFTYQTTPAGAWDGLIRCRVLEAVANERLVYAWTGGDAGNVGYGARLDTVVTLTLTRVAEGTRLRVVHAGFELPRNETTYRNMSDGWTKVLRRLNAVATEENR